MVVESIRIESNFVLRIDLIHPQPFIA